MIPVVTQASRRALPLLAGLFALLAPCATAQRGPEMYGSKTWSVSNGLPQGSINDIVQTRDGALWVATFGGLLRFDGIEFRVYDLDTLAGLPSNRVTALAADDADGLWLATQNGWLIHCSGDRVVERVDLGAMLFEPLCLARHPGGSLWVQDSRGLVCRVENGAGEVVLGGESRGGSYEGLCVNLDGSISVAFGAEVVLLEPSGVVRCRIKAPERVLSVMSGDEDGPWIGLADGLAHVVGGAVRRLPITLPGPVRVHALIADGMSGHWLGTARGIVHLSGVGTPARSALVMADFDLPNGIPVRALARDREGNIWVGSDGVGLVRLRPHRLESFGPLDWRDSVCALTEDGEGGMFVANDCKGLSHIDYGRWDATRVELPAPLEGRDCIESLFRDRHGRIWAGRDRRMLRNDDPRGSGEFQPVLPDLPATSHIGRMLESPAGDLWITLVTGKLVRVGPDDRILETIDLPAAAYSLAQARDGGLWVGGDGELFHVQRGRVEHFGLESGLPRGVYRDLLCDDSGDVWIASYGGGLGRFRGGRGSTISRAQGLPDNSLTCILEDADRRLWILTNLGLVVTAREPLLELCDGRRLRFDPVVLGPEAGMIEANSGSPAGVRDVLDRLWFGTLSGPFCVDPAEFPFNRTPLEVVIDGVVAGESPLALGPSVEVPPGTRRLVFSYAACALTGPERVHYRYRLEGFDPEWIENGAKRSAEYTALAPGRYSFHVEARNEDGVWSRRPTSVVLQVLPSWWQTPLFQVSAVLAVLGLLLLLHRHRVSVIHRRAAVLLEATEGRARAEERESRLREELAHAGRVATAGELATTLAHEVNQPLAAIVTNAQAGRRFLARGPVERADMDEILGDIAQQGQRASEVIRRLREFLRKHGSERSMVDVNQVVKDTLPLVRRELEDHGVEARLALEGDLPSVLADPVQLQQVVVNLVKNACEAMAGHPGPRRVEIQSGRYDGRVWMNVRDTGPGLAPDLSGRLFQPYVTTKAGGMGLGLAICRSIVEAHGGRVSAEPAVPSGLSVRIDLPEGRDDEVQP